MGNRIYLTFVSVVAGLFIFTGIALPAKSYFDYQEASKADFRVKVSAKVLEFTVADPDEGLFPDSSPKRFYAPVVHFQYTAPGEDTSRKSELLIPFSGYWSRSSLDAKTKGQQLYPVGGYLDLYLSERDPGKCALRPSEIPVKYYLLLGPVGVILFLFGIFLLVHRARAKKELKAAEDASMDDDY